MPRSLSKGTTGADVRELQAALNFHVRAPNEPLQPDGIFGPKTDERTRHFQGLAGINADGIVGPITLQQLYRSTNGALHASMLRPPPTFRASPLRFGDRPVIPDRVPPLRLRMPQARAAKGVGYQFESKLMFNPLADGKDDHRLQFTIAQELPWPIFLPSPVQLEVDAGVDAKGRPKLDGKIKIPYKIVPNRMKSLEIKPYFFFGAGTEANHFTGLNAGAGSSLTLTLVEALGGSGPGFKLIVDGGVKFSHDVHKGESKASGIFTTGVILSF